MKVIALVSGGKDSCFNMVLCQRYGHEIVALANLVPPRSDVDDIDSYMYQTVGHQVIEAYAACMGLPLYRRRILGASKDQALVYHDTAGDEVEDLTALLAYAKQDMPEIQAVSSGAIASDYQRTRVERVCSRLGLVSLAYLWHQPQDPLLQRMIDAEVGAILVKVAAAGLNPERHLGASLPQMQRHLRSLRSLYGCNVCGEGGEYETLTLSCPSLFTHGSISLDSWEIVHVSEDSMAPVGLLHPTSFHVDYVIPKTESFNSTSGKIISVPDVFLSMYSVADVLNAERTNNARDDFINPSVTRSKQRLSVSLIQKQQRSACGETNMRGSTFTTIAARIERITRSDDDNDNNDKELTLEAMKMAFDAIQAKLENDWSDALFVHLYVPSMAQFGTANNVYSQFLPAINPPARATVQLAGSDDTTVLLVEVLLGPPQAHRLHDKKVLHVQSISEWAPSCIGPYSQAVAFSNLVYFAGQIPLDPPTMAVATSNPPAAMKRSLESCQAVAIAMKTDLRYGCLWWTIYFSGAVNEAGRYEAGCALTDFLLDSRLNNNDNNTDHQEGSGSDEDTDTAFIDDYLLPPPMYRQWEPLKTFIQLPELPRGVAVEVQPVAWSQHGTRLDTTSDSDSSASSDGDDDVTDQNYMPQPRWLRSLVHSNTRITYNDAIYIDVHRLHNSSDNNSNKTTLAKKRCVQFIRTSVFVVCDGVLYDVGAVEAAAALAAANTGIDPHPHHHRQQQSNPLIQDFAWIKMYYVPEKLKNISLSTLRDSVERCVNQPGALVPVPVLRVGPTPEATAAVALEFFTFND